MEQMTPLDLIYMYFWQDIMQKDGWVDQENYTRRKDINVWLAAAHF